MDDADTEDERMDEAIAPAAGSTGDSDLIAEVVEYGNGTRECTLYPSDADADQDVTAWITARDGSFMDLRSVR